MRNTYLKDYLNRLSELITDFNHIEFLNIIKILKQIKKNKKKVIIVVMAVVQPWQVM